MRDASTHALSPPARAVRASRLPQLLVLGLALMALPLTLHPAPRRDQPGRRRTLAEDDNAFSPTALGAIVLFIIGGFLAAQIAIETLAGMLPGYLTSLGTIFDAIDAVNTTNWPPVVATMFGFLDVVIGVIAIAALFGAGALLTINFSRKGKGSPV